MGVDDRPADRQPHAHAIGLGGVEGVEQAVHGLRGEPRTRILDRNQHSAGPVSAEPEGRFSRRIAYALNAAHGRASPHSAQNFWCDQFQAPHLQSQRMTATLSAGFSGRVGSWKGLGSVIALPDRVSRTAPDRAEILSPAREVNGTRYPLRVIECLVAVVR